MSTGGPTTGQGTTGLHAAQPAPTVHEAERASGPSGAVLWGAEITGEEAVVRRLAGLDGVVRGPDQKANRRQAGAIEAFVGPCFPS